MNDPNLAPKNYMAAFGIGIIVLVAAYYLFLAIDCLDLNPEQAVARVTGKNYRPAGTSYTTEYINKRPQVIPQGTPEAYALELEIEGEKAEAAVSKEIYDAASISKTVVVGYERRRLTGILQISDVKLGGN